VGNFKNNGREWRPQSTPEPVNIHDCRFLPDGENRGPARRMSSLHHICPIRRAHTSHTDDDLVRLMGLRCCGDARGRFHGHSADTNQYPMRSGLAVRCKRSCWLVYFARPKRFEPPTPRFVVWCSLRQRGAEIHQGLVVRKRLAGTYRADHSMISLVGNQQYDYPERTGISVRAER
jgi:hypothetical protein